MAEDDMDEVTARRQVGLTADLCEAALAEDAVVIPATAYAAEIDGRTRTVERQVDYGKSLYASGKADGAREARTAAYKEQCGCFDEATSSFWEGCEVCGGKGAEGIGEMREREAVVAALERRQLFLAEHFARPDVELRHQEVDELLRIVQAGEHRKEAAHG